MPGWNKIIPFSLFTFDTFRSYFLILFIMKENSYKSAFLLLTFWLPAIILHAQTLGLSGGINRNRYFDLNREDSPHFSTSYSPGNGCSFVLSLSDIRFDTLMPMRISLLYENYKGHFFTTYGGLAGYTNIDADVERTTLGIAIFPVNLTLFQHLEFSLGVSASRKIKDYTRGQKDSWIAGVGTYDSFSDDKFEFNNLFTWGVNTRVAYRIDLTNEWLLVPEYNFYAGLSDDLKNCNANIRSMRHSLMVGLCRTFR